jgi:nicotinate-nucleotide adenylyltransferase
MRRGFIGVFGGAFAPFHTGHLRLAIEARERLGLSQLRLVPTAHPPHRPDSRVSPQRRYEWVRLATRRERGLLVDDCEIRRSGPSYTVDTLADLHKQHPRTPLCLLMGADAFAHLHMWHRWKELLQLAHLAVIVRPGAPAPSAEVLEALAGREASDAATLRESHSGCWIRLEIPALDISSTRIRSRLKAGQSVRGLVPDAIIHSFTPADIAALTQDEDSITH